MIFKLIFLIMLCVPIGCFQCYLVLDAAKDLKKAKKDVIEIKSSVRDVYSKKDHLRVAK
ncbi:hypothetical protein [Marinisporobacter balticus]|uniref:Uncharacterized protein n=1 Tax=Marinisporobacter balticus TaxID=2018667 RepID=A0A4V6NPH1_9FIRM|nr:hypothetical protein [Marinisporobacter balticus]TCO78620.1 hypothetical protein EV214_1043 [Marinisporobacter balticus]